VQTTTLLSSSGVKHIVNKAQDASNLSMPGLLRPSLATSQRP